MDPVLVAVGSKRAPKLQAVSEALAAFGPAVDLETKFEIVGVSVPSGVGHTPLSRSELMAGAHGRAVALERMAGERGEAWGYFVGLEGGIEVLHEDGVRLAFLETWAYVSDTTGRGAYGHSGGLLLPEALAIEVLDQGRELADVIDEYIGERGIRDGQGVSGVLTAGLITRQEIVRMAAIHAFAPFLNTGIYGPSFI